MRLTGAEIELCLRDGEEGELRYVVAVTICRLRPLRPEKIQRGQDIRQRLIGFHDAFLNVTHIATTSSHSSISEPQNEGNKKRTVLIRDSRRPCRDLSILPLPQLPPERRAVRPVALERVGDLVGVPGGPKFEDRVVVKGPVLRVL